MLNISSRMSAQMQLSLVDEGGLALQTRLTSAHSSKYSDGQWMEKKQENDKAQEPIVTTQNEDNDVIAKVVKTKNSNGSKRVHQCPMCLKRFGAPSKLKRHCLIHTDQKPFQCSICCRAFRERSHLKAHIRTHTNPSSADAVTTAGKRIFPVSKSSDRMCTLQLKKKSVYQCEICLKKFSFPSKLTRHLCVHFDARAYTCTICRKSFKQAYYLHKHLRVHRGKRNGNSKLCSVPQKHGAKSPTPGAFECTNNCRLDAGNACLTPILDSLETKKHEKPECRSKLKQNVQFVESNSSIVGIKSSDTLKNAEVQITTSSTVGLKHTHKGMHQCSICLKNFQYPSKLARHILSHTDIRPFKCHVCMKSFQFRWHLQCHVKIHKKKGQNIIADHLEQDRTVSFSNAAKSEENDVQVSLQDGAEDSARVHQDQNMVKNMLNQKLSGGCSDSGVYLHVSIINEQSSAYSSEPSESQWMEEIQESEEEQEASVTTQNEDNGVNSKVWQRKNCNRSKRVYDCPVCHKKFGAPSELKRHCLIHTNQRPFQCPICCRAFREHSHLKVHIRTHTNPEKRTRSLQSYKENSVTCNLASKSKLKPCPKQPTAQDDTKSTDKEMSTVHQDQNMVTENMVSQKICVDCNDSCLHLPDYFLNEGGWDRHTGWSSAYFSKPSEGQWMEENQKTGEQQEANLTTQNKDNDVHSKVWQSKKSDGNKRVYYCPVCHKRFGAPSELKRHCLIHTNQRPFQCPICCRAFRERSHLKVHIRTHDVPVKRRTPSLQSYRDNIVSCNRASESQPSPKFLTAHNDTTSTNKQKSTVQQDQNVLTEDMLSQKICGDCNDSGVHFPDSLLIEGGWDRHTGQSSAYSSKPSESQWMEEIQESEEEREANLTTQNEDKDVNEKALQSRNSNINKRVYDCPVCHKKFDAPSELKRHCLIHTNQRPFQCSICCRAFRERSHLKVHLRTHTNPVKRRTRSLQSYKDNSVPCYQTSKSRLKSSPKYITVQNNTSSTEKQQSAVHQYENMVTEIVGSQIISGECSESDAYLEDSLLNKEGLDLHTGLSSAYSPKPSESQWMEEIQESEEEEEASVTTQNEDNGANSKVWQSKNCNRSKRVYYCPVCRKRFGAPSELKRHCLIHTNQRPFQCPICCRAFRERSHLKVHFSTHNIRKKRRAPSLQSYRVNSVPCNHASKSRLKSSPKQTTAQDDTKSTDKEKSTVHQEEKMVIENMASQIISCDCSESDACLLDSLLNKKGWDRHTGLSSLYFSKPSEGQWMEEIQESEEKQESNVSTQSEDDVNLKVLQSKKSDGNKRVYDCPVCHKRFGAPSELKRHCLIHTNQRPFQCSICCRAFRERSHLKVHIRTHDVPVKRRTPSLHTFKDNIDARLQDTKSQPSPKFLTAHNDTSSTNKQKSTVQQDQNVLTEDMLSQKICGGCNDSGVYFPDSLLIEGGWDRHTGQSSAYSSKPSESQWMEEIQESEEEREANLTTQNEDKDVNEKALQSRNSNINKRVYDCPVCRKKFDAPSELKRHCLIHTNQRPFQCSICCRAFRERSHLKVHIRTHTNPVRRRTRSLQSYKDNSVPCYQTSKSRLKSSPKYITVQNNASSTEKQQSAVHQYENMVTEIVGSQIISGECSESDAYLEDSLLNKEGLDLHTGLSSAYSPKPSESQWMEEIQESEEEQEASVTTQNEDNGANSKVWQSKNYNESKRVYYCPVCRKRFGAPSELKRHCLIHTNQRPFQCSICCRAFRERSHLKVHFSTHNIRKKRRAPSLQSYRVNSVPCNHASKSRLKSSPKQTTAQDDTKSTDKEKSTVHQEEKMVIENMASQIISCDCSESDACLLDSLLNKKGWDRHTGLSSLYFSKPSEGQWMEEIQESEEKQESNVSTQSEDDVNLKVLQSKKSDGNKRVYDCPVCHKRFGAPSELKRHCLIHTNQRPFQCSICCRAFRERSHLKVHIRTHDVPVKRRTPSLHTFKDNIDARLQDTKSQPSPKFLTAHNDTSSTNKQKSTVQQDQNVLTEDMLSQKICGGCNDSGVYFPDSLLIEGGWDRHTGQSSAYSSKPSESQWMEEIQESEEEREANLTTQNEDKDVNEKALQSRNSNINKRVYDCPVCRKKFDAPSELKRHCLIHTNQRPFQCSICCRAFRERSHLKVHIRTHTNPVRRRTRSLQSYKDNSVPCYQTSKSRLKSSPKYITVQNNASSTEKQQSAVHQYENMVTEIVGSQIISGECSESDAYLEDSLLNKEGLDLHTGLSSAYSPKPSESQWMEEIQESEEQQEASVTTQNEDNGANSKVWQSKNYNESKRVYYCPVCRKRFGAPSELKRHCLIHTNQRPFQCSICCRAFRERSHLKVHFSTHNIRKKRRAPSLQSYRVNSVPCNHASKSRLKSSPKQTTAQDDTKSTDKEKSTVHQEEKMVIENMASQIISCDCSESDACLLDSLLNKKGWDHHTGLSSLYFSKPSEGQWMEEIQESEEKQESNVSTQSEDDVNLKVLQSKKSDGNKRVYDCPVCHKRFGAPSELKRHCLIHTNQRPFQCSICCRAFRERSHLKVHIRTHDVPVKRRTPSLHTFKDNIDARLQDTKSQPSPKFLTAHNDTSSTNKQKSTVQQDQNVLTEDMLSQKICGGCNDSGVYFPDSLLIEGGWDRHTGQSSAYSSKPSESQWMEEIQESEEEREANLTTQNEDKDLNEKALQSRNSNVNKRVYDCPVCRKRFDAPSELKRHCLIHTNQRPFQCSICCRAFRERSHLKVHLRTHTNPVRRRTRSLQSYKDNSVPCYQTSKSRLKPSPQYLTVQNNASSTEKQQSAVHQYENIVTEIVGSQIISGECSESDAYLEDSVLDKEDLDLQIGFSSAYFSSNSESQWMEEIQESEEEQEASVTTQNVDNDLDSKVWQSKNCNRSKRVYDCPVCHKRFGAPSELKRHCLIHTNQRPFQCSICCRAFRERSHLKVHIRTHYVPVKRRTPSLQSYRDNIVSCNRTSESKLKPSPKFLTARNDTSSTNKQKSTVQQDQNVLTEDMLSQKICGDYNDSSVYLSKSTSPLENVENNKSVWGLTHKTDILLDGKKASDIVPFGRVSDCPPKTDSSLHHCAPESRTEEKWEHYMDDVEDVFVDSDTVVTQCVPGSHEPSSCQYQQNPDVPRIPEVVVELEDFDDPGECFIKTSHDLPFCRDCSRSFRTVRNLYAHNCTNGYPEDEVKKSHQCDICFKFFSAPSKLKRHYVTHTGQRPFLCTQCQKSFTQPHHLKTHMLSHR